MVNYSPVHRLLENKAPQGSCAEKQINLESNLSKAGCDQKVQYQTE